MKKYLSVILAALLTASVFSACNAAKPSEVPKEAPSSVQTSSEITTETPDSSDDSDTETPIELPASVDLRNYNGKNYVTPVKRQAFGDCWSFGNIAAAESSYLYANDLGTPAGQDNINVNFSERYLGWYVYHSITPEDVTPGKVRASQIGEGYDLTEAESKKPSISFLLGGASQAGSIVFASGFGPVDESIEVDGENPYAYSNNNILDTEDYENYSPSGDWSIPINSKYRNPPIAALLRNGNILPSPASYDSAGNYSYDEEALRMIKNELAHGRAVAMTALVFGRMNYENWAAYTDVFQQNHVITVIGYDDNYPKENFAKVDSDGNTEEGSIPPTDGAFIIKDSYGETGGIDGLGTFFISYHDHTMSDFVSFEFDKNDSVKYTNLNYDQYDLLLPGWCAHADYSSEAKMANVFDVEEEEYLYQITYRTSLPNTSVHYEIFRDPKDGTPDSGTLLEEGDNTHLFRGSHKIDLKDTYNFTEGEMYSVVLTMKYTTDSGNSTYTAVIPFASSMIPYGEQRSSEVKPTGVINKGESYLFSEGKWTDLTELKSEYAQTAYDQHSSRRLPESFVAENADGIAVDNFPIKAILIPASDYKS